VAQHQGRKVYQEDYTCVQTQLDLLYNTHGYKVSFLGVFDGHGGKAAALYACAHLFHFTLTAFARDGDGTAALHFGFAETDRLYNKFAAMRQNTAGTTAATALLLERDGKRTIVAANCGDSEIMVVHQDGSFRVLSVLHTTANRSECERVKSDGGTIICLGGNRVNGILIVTRSIGDPEHPQVF
jgi:serine/threonine protein phosphatase PrpC